MTLLPRSEAELSEILRSATTPFAIQGGGTRGFAQRVAGTALSTAGLTGVKLYEPGALTLVVAAGTPLEEVNALIAEQGQRLAFEPYDSRPLLGTSGTPTIGSVVAANISGPARVTAGAARDFLLGLRYIDGNGTIIANGGRVMKNVTGYDLSRLLAGSFGTYGVITEVALKLLPRPETSATLLIEGLSLAEAVKAMSAALGTSCEVNGAAFDGTAVLLRLEGFAPSVSYRLTKLQGALAPFGPSRSIADEASRALWLKIRDAEPLKGAGDIWRISCRPSDAAYITSKINGETLLDWGGGLIWARVPAGFNLRTALGPLHGHATCLKGPHQAFQPEAQANGALARALRAQSDPKALLNPGLMD